MRTSLMLVTQAAGRLTVGRLLGRRGEKEGLGAAGWRTGAG